MQDEEELIQKNIRFPQDLWQAVEEVVGPRGRSEFVRNAVQQAVDQKRGDRRITDLEQRVAALEAEVAALKSEKGDE